MRSCETVTAGLAVAFSATHDWSLNLREQRPPSPVFASTRERDQLANAQRLAGMEAVADAHRIGRHYGWGRVVFGSAPGLPLRWWNAE